MDHYSKLIFLLLIVTCIALECDDQDKRCNYLSSDNLVIKGALSDHVNIIDKKELNKERFYKRNATKNTKLFKRESIFKRNINKHDSIYNNENNQYNKTSNIEIVARTILYESRFKFYDEYDAIAWVLFNRVKSGKFPTNAKDVAIDPSFGGQFEYWNDLGLNGKKCIPTSKESLQHKDYKYVYNLAMKILENNPPTEFDTTNNSLFFIKYSPGIEHLKPNGVRIGGNWFRPKWD